MNRLIQHLPLLQLFAVWVWSSLVVADTIPDGLQVRLPAPATGDTCSVCGMFVSKYPEWLATVLYKDGHSDHFDGAKDMFKYLHNLDKYAPGHRYEDISAIGVTEYYGLTMIDAKQARFVIGSDVTGPMGHELIPLASQEEAEEFLQDHQGGRILTFDQVDQGLLRRLDDGEVEE